ncbi:helix-turn-helix domain-containing protein [Yinghuangia sp. ASG 101]|uniref:helix-turn-helix domain-containing protein n=1 Tax=Yinghuangia sp. ASG 101 TaxID=2896848 RepID=UPI001E640312|nr:helix-turn-helix domain-containing protein [Yinghuangia sp. ASG 101]UGQ09117.1 helix-turn-helix domain-containing protein [Yinghuangia sp. ASG 101]
MSQLLHRAPSAAKRSGLGLTTVKALIKTGELRSIKIGRARFVPDAALLEFIARLDAEQNGPQVG